ncbi:MAG TPA: DUF6531 domain-containing protein [Polyangiaceae bacterium]|nr:DUF6531 domain-containing protein [Polyangiaceae bacterium]
MIGGFPCPGIGEMALGGILKGLKAVGKAARAKVAGKAAARRANGKQCDGGEPIYLVTGEVYTHSLDYASGGLFEWHRHYTSARSKEDSAHGRGQRHFYQRTLRRRLHRATFVNWDGPDTEFGRFERGSDVVRSGGYVLRRLGRGHFRITHRDEPALEFIGGEFDNEIKLSKVVSPERELTLHYDPLGRLGAALELDRKTGTGARFEFRYDASHHLSEIWQTQANPQAGLLAQKPVLLARYVYSAQNDLTSVVDALGRVSRYEYDAAHWLTKQTDARGYSYSYAYDIHGRCTDSSGSDGLWWCHIEYPEEGLTRYTEGDSATWQLHYDKAGVVSKIVEPYGGEKLRELDSEGKLVLETDSGGRTLRWLYDSDGAHYARVDRFSHLFPPEAELPTPPNPFARTLPSTALGFMFARAVEPDSNLPQQNLGFEPSPHRSPRR